MPTQSRIFASRIEHPNLNEMHAASFVALSGTSWNASSERRIYSRGVRVRSVQCSIDAGVFHVSITDGWRGGGANASLGVRNGGLGVLKALVQ
jgi:hypothetical protein